MGGFWVPGVRVWTFRLQLSVLVYLWLGGLGPFKPYGVLSRELRAVAVER